MADGANEDLSQHVDRIRTDIASLTETVRQLVSDTAGIQATLKQRVNSAARHAAQAGGDILGEASALGEEAVDAAARGATAAIDTIETQIARNPLTAVLIALGFGFAVGLLSRTR
jgi:ElaB/YqjD/DUF883 family membrane-anchored ribosome-binding protein